MPTPTRMHADSLCIQMARIPTAEAMACANGMERDAKLATQNKTGCGPCNEKRIQTGWPAATRRQVAPMRTRSPRFGESVRSDGLRGGMAVYFGVPMKGCRQACTNGGSSTDYIPARRIREGNGFSECRARPRRQPTYAGGDQCYAQGANPSPHGPPPHLHFPPPYRLPAKSQRVGGVVVICPVSAAVCGAAGGEICHSPQTSANLPCTRPHQRVLSKPKPSDTGSATAAAPTSGPSCHGLIPVPYFPFRPEIGYTSGVGRHVSARFPVPTHTSLLR